MYTQIAIIVSDFQDQGQPVLNQKIQSLITDLQAINKQKNNFEVSLYLLLQTRFNN